jgi:hypothetical protein
LVCRLLKIALVGRSQVGKSFCAEYLRVNHGFERKQMNEPLKEFIKKLYYFDKGKRVSWETQRAMYDAIYKIDNNIWITSMRGRMRTAYKDVVIDDARYMNEVKELIKMDFKVIRVTRPRNQMKLGKVLGKNADKGTLLLHELYNKDFTTELNVNYTIHNENRESTKQSLDIIIEELRAQN